MEVVPNLFTITTFLSGSGLHPGQLSMILPSVLIHMAYSLLPIFHPTQHFYWHLKWLWDSASRSSSYYSYQHHPICIERALDPYLLWGHSHLPPSGHWRQASHQPSAFSHPPSSTNPWLNFPVFLCLLLGWTTIVSSLMTSVCFYYPLDFCQDDMVIVIWNWTK